MQFYAVIKKTSSVHLLWSRMGKRFGSLHGVAFVLKAGRYVSEEVRDAAKIAALKAHRGIELSVTSEAPAAPATAEVPEAPAAPATAEAPVPIEPEEAPVVEDADAAFDRAAPRNRYTAAKPRK